LRNVYEAVSLVSFLPQPGKDMSAIQAKVDANASFDGSQQHHPDLGHFQTLNLASQACQALFEREHP
jgi:hypothetical protein